MTVLSCGLVVVCLFMWSLRLQSDVWRISIFLCNQVFVKPHDISLMVGSFGSFFVISGLTNETLFYEACQDLLKWVSSGTLVSFLYQ